MRLAHEARIRLEEYRGHDRTKRVMPSPVANLQVGREPVSFELRFFKYLTGCKSSQPALDCS